MPRFFSKDRAPSRRFTYASSSCFILANSSLVIDPSPSPSFCIFSRGPSKSGFVGAGGICSRGRQLVSILILAVVLWLGPTGQPVSLLTLILLAIEKECPPHNWVFTLSTIIYSVYSLQATDRVQQFILLQCQFKIYI